jgi:hypothetical protein
MVALPYFNEPVPVRYQALGVTAHALTLTQLPNQ